MMEKEARPKVLKGKTVGILRLEGDYRVRKVVV